MTARRWVVLGLGLAASGAVGVPVLTHGGSGAAHAPAVASRRVVSPVAADPVPLHPAPVKPSPTAAARQVVVRRVALIRPVVRKPVVTVTVAKPKLVSPAETPNQRGQRVLASLHYDWQKLGYRIVFLPEKKGYLGFTDAATKTVTIWVRRTETDNVLAHTIAHELGHALDFTKGSPAKHAAYLSLRGLNPATSWYGCNGCTDYRTPAGDWAEVFAYWLAGPGDFRSQLAPPPDRAHMLAIAQLYSF